MSDGPITLAFAGDGPVTQANVRELLNDWLGYGPVGDNGFPEETDREINLIFPISKEHLTPAVQEVLDWSEWVDLPYTAVHNADTSADIKKILDDATNPLIKATNINAKVIELLREVEGEKYVIISWGEGSDVAEVLLDLATDAGIKCLQLDAGLDDLTFDNDADPEEAPPKPEPPAAPRARGRRQVAPEPLTEEEVALTEADEKPESEPVRSARKAAAEFAERIEKAQAPHRAKAAAPKDELQEQVNIAAQTEVFTGAREGIDWATQRVLDIQQTIDALKVDLDHASRYLVWVKEAYHTQLETVPKAPTEEPVVGTTTKSRGRPRKDGSPAQARTEPETTTYIDNEDGTYTKKGRGRPRADEILVELTDEQAAQVEVI